MYPRKRYSVPLPEGRSLELGERTLVMGILNITPDSFADGGVHYDVDRAVDAGMRMVSEGADILDIGGESTRPGAEQVGAEEEMRRVLPVIDRLARATDTPLSIDTYKASVAREAIARGATIVLDPGFGFAKRAEHSFELLAKLPTLVELGRPILSGTSRKSFLKAALG